MPAPLSGGNIISGVSRLPTINYCCYAPIAFRLHKDTFAASEKAISRQFAEVVRNISKLIPIKYCELA